MVCRVSALDCPPGPSFREPSTIDAVLPNEGAEGRCIQAEQDEQLRIVTGDGRRLVSSLSIASRRGRSETSQSFNGPITHVVLAISHRGRARLEEGNRLGRLANPANSCIFGFLGLSL